MKIVAEPLLRLPTVYSDLFGCHYAQKRTLKFQREMNIILSSVKWPYPLVYLDDIFMYSESSDKHISPVGQVLTLLNEAGVTLKLKNCEFFTNRIAYLGHVIKPGGQAVSSYTIDAIGGLQTPSNITELLSFLGRAMCSPVRTDFVRMMALLNRKF